MQGHAMIRSGLDTFFCRTDFPPSSGHILGADSISCLVGQNFLEKCVPPDISAWRTDFPLTPVSALQNRVSTRIQYCSI